VGIVLATWRYMWSTAPVHRWEMNGSWPADAPPEMPPQVDRSEMQSMEEGVGPMLHRIYRTRIVGAGIGGEDLMAQVRADPDRVAPSEFATFQRLEGEGPLAVGDDYVVRMPGPWDGPVRVIAADATCFRLATLEGHLEAGQIEFRVAEDHRSLSFEIESWACAGDRLSALLYNHLGISKEVQLHMWSSFLRRAVGLAGGRMENGIVITTRSVAASALPHNRPQRRADRAIARRLAALAELAVNFNQDEIDAHIADKRWRVDDMVEPLPHEGSGPPAEGGSWRVAREIMDSYQLADPAVVSASYAGDGPLAGRDMLLRIRFGPLRFRVGVRVGEVYEDTVELDGRKVLIFGWSYRTLQGHFEQGQMHYELWKWLDSGDVEFHLRAVSRAADSGPLLLRTGFRLFGRGHQLRFYRQVCRRIKRLTEAQLETERAAASRRALQAP
jgi:uncharacterized protein (UPF0548 family)